MKEYEIQVQLSQSHRDDWAEWVESTLVDAATLDAAHAMARKFARLCATEQNAKIESYWAIDLETGEQS